MLNTLMKASCGVLFLFTEYVRKEVYPKQMSESHINILPFLFANSKAFLFSSTVEAQGIIPGSINFLVVNLILQHVTSLPYHYHANHDTHHTSIRNCLRHI